MSVSNPPARKETFTPAPVHPGAESRDRSTSQTVHLLRRIGAPRPVAFWHLASFDAPTVAVIWSLSFGWIAGIRLPLWIPALLALTVWAVYVGDRLLDARSGVRNLCFDRLRERHYFHWRHRRILLPLAAAAAGLAAWMVFLWMKPATRDEGSILAAVSLAYFARVHSRRTGRPFLSRVLTKELLVGVLFTFGCALPVLGRLPAASPGTLWPVLCAMAFFALLAWLNCHAIDFWESRAFDGSEHRSAHAAAPFSVACLLALLGFLLAMLLSAAYPRTATLLLAGGVSAALLAWLDCRRNRLSTVALRAAADLVLLTPALFIPLIWMAR